MYSRAEASQIRQAFWMAFGQYMTPQRSAESDRINWVNYKTGEKDISFKMHADTKTVSIGIELTHKDNELQQLYFEQFEQFRTLLRRYLAEEWLWHLHAKDENERTISRIFTERTSINIMKREDWPEAISFFKPRIIALDAFWSDVRFAFEALR